MLPWRVTAIVDVDRALVASGDQTLEVNRAFEPELDEGDEVLVSCGIVVRRLAADEAAELRSLLASATQESEPSFGPGG
jgi:hydrogenase maturation factor